MRKFYAALVLFLLLLPTSFKAESVDNFKVERTRELNLEGVNGSYYNITALDFTTSQSILINKLYECMSNQETSIKYCYTGTDAQMFASYYFFEETFSKVQSIDSINNLNDGEIIRYYLYTYSWNYFYQDNMVYVDLTIYYRNNRQEVTNTNNYLRSVVNSLKLDGCSEYVKTVRIYRWIAKKYAYDYTYVDCTDVLAQKKNKTTCMGYSMILHKMLEIARVESLSITGWTEVVNDVGTSDSYHAWNAVKIEGKWYYCDVCWDEDSNGVDLNYFLRSAYSNQFNTRLVEERIRKNTLAGKPFSDTSYKIMIKFNSSHVSKSKRIKYITPSYEVKYPKPKRKGYKCLYWYNSKTKKKVNDTTSFYEPTTLKVKWKRITN